MGERLVLSSPFYILIYKQYPRNFTMSDIFQDNMLLIVVISFVVILGGALIVVAGDKLSTSVVTDYLFPATATVPSTMSYSVSSVTSMQKADNQSVNGLINVTADKGNTTVTIINPASQMMSNITVIHRPGIAGLNIDVFVNTHNVGTLTDNPTDTFNISPGHLSNGGNLVVLQ